MNISSPRTQGVAAWVRSLRIALFFPALIWPIVFSLKFLWSDYLNSFDYHTLIFGIIVGGIAIVPHFLCYSIFGLPLFLHKYAYPRSIVWRWSICFPAGMILGLLAWTLIYLCFRSGQVEGSNWSLLWVGSFYGVVSAFAAYRNRPKQNRTRSSTPIHE